MVTTDKEIILNTIVSSEENFMLEKHLEKKTEKKKKKKKATY